MEEEQTVMMTLGDADSHDARGFLHKPGAFAWRYLDVLDENGSGAVIIWGFGIPFLPDSADGERRGWPAPAASRPSVNVALYERGECSAYFFREFLPSQVAWSGPGELQLGESRFRSVSNGERCELRADVKLHTPGGPEFRCQASLDGPAVSGLPAPLDGEHVWSPISLAPASVEAACGDKRWKISGSGYHDRNASPRSLTQLGIQRWRWGRASSHLSPSAGGSHLVHWHLEGTRDEQQSWLIDISSEGNARVQTADSKRRPGLRTRWGLPTDRHLQVGEAEVHTGAELDGGPFYRRTLSKVNYRGAELQGVSELIVPHRRDGVFSPLVRMAVSSTKQDSVWLPLFAGPRSSRWSRLIQSWRA